MVILSKRLKKEGNAAFMIGTYIPKRLATFLSLYCLAHGKTKTSVIKALLNNWVKRNQDKESEDELIQLIVQRAYDSWKNGVKKRKSWKVFESDLIDELEKNHLKDYIATIIGLIYDKKSKDETES